jgi:hypothetical protein
MRNYVQDMPKIECPFVREETDEGYLAIDKVNVDDDGNSYSWVFEDDRVMAIEKLHGSNVSVMVKGGRVQGVWNRENRIPAWGGNGTHRYIREGIDNAIQRGYLDMLLDGQHFGELIGPSYHGNPYDLEEHMWIPFEPYARRHLQYESWGRYDKSFGAIRNWFDMGLIPLFYSRWHDLSFDEAEGAFVEGIMFTHPEPDEVDTLPYAKVRYDMFAFDQD